MLVSNIDAAIERSDFQQVKVLVEAVNEEVSWRFTFIFDEQLANAWVLLIRVSFTAQGHVWFQRLLRGRRVQTVMASHVPVSDFGRQRMRSQAVSDVRQASEVKGLLRFVKYRERK